jgi:hypothetical protein
MPSGFGFYDGKKPIAKELRVLKGLKPGTTPTPLAESTTAAVVALAKANGIVLPKVSSGGSSSNHDRYILGAALLAFLAVLFVPARVLRTRSAGD